MTITGAQIIAQTLKGFGVKAIFGIVGIPVVEIAEEAINLGIRFIGFRNEQAASYAAGAYGYLTGFPGVCLVVGGPGVLHALAGVGNATANNFPLLLLAGSSDTHLAGKGAFQEMDAIVLLKPRTKLSIRPASLEMIPDAIENAYKACWYGRPGSAFVDLPADLIQDGLGEQTSIRRTKRIPPLPTARPVAEKVKQAAELIRQAKSPLIVIGKGAVSRGAPGYIRKLVDSTTIHFLPTPMGKGVVPDSHPQNVASARSTALKHADVVLLIGARLNWILQFGEPPKWRSDAHFIQIDVSTEELDHHRDKVELGLAGDIVAGVREIALELEGWRWQSDASGYTRLLQESRLKNEAAAAEKARVNQIPMTYARAFDVIRSALHKLSPPESGGIVYISEGANTMDISRPMFHVEEPRLRLDAGTNATMGVGPGYAIAAHMAYNTAETENSSGFGYQKKKKIINFEGDSAFGFSAMEVETMARYGMDILIFVLNNGGIYHGNSTSRDEWLKLQRTTLGGSSGTAAAAAGLRSTSLGWETRYEKLAEACGGLGFFVRTAGELERATREGFLADVPVVINIIIEAGSSKKLEVAWQASSK